MLMALIPPVKNLELTKQGNMYMILTHLVHSSAEYREFYRNQTDKFKILDNGAFEDALNDIESICNAAAMVSADEIILPDIILDGKATIEETKKALQWLAERNLHKKYKLMTVPQGRSEDEWWECFFFMNDHPMIDAIGLSKLSCPIAFKSTIAKSRLKITQTMLNCGYVNDAKEYHLLVMDLLNYLKKSKSNLHLLEVLILALHLNMEKES